MCCCIPLRRLSYFASGMHIMIGTLYFFFLGDVTLEMYKMRNSDNNLEMRKVGLLYIGYYAAFLPPGVFILYGVHKKCRCFLVVPSVIFLIVQGYGMTLECIYGYRPHWLPEVMYKWNMMEARAKLRADYWMDVCIQITVTLVYVFMLFFYWREIGPEDSPIESRYTQSQNRQFQQQLIPQQQSFRPLSSQSHGHSLRNSTPTPLPPQQSINLAAMGATLNHLTFDQQQQLLKLQQHPILLQQLQQHLGHLESSPHSHHLQPLQQQQPQSLYHHNSPYAQMMDPNKTPKF